MSLIKTYAVGCEGPSLAARLGRTKAGPGVMFHNHVPFSRYAVSSQKARRDAIQAGWSRVTRTFPIFADQPKGPTTDQKFDLCPSCTDWFGDK